MTEQARLVLIRYALNRAQEELERAVSFSGRLTRSSTNTPIHEELNEILYCFGDPATAVREKLRIAIDRIDGYGADGERLPKAGIS